MGIREPRVRCVIEIEPMQRGCATVKRLVDGRRIASHMMNCRTI